MEQARIEHAPNGSLLTYTLYSKPAADVERCYCVVNYSLTRSMIKDNIMPYKTLAFKIGLWSALKIGPF